MSKLPKGPTAATAAMYPFTGDGDDITTCHICGFRSDGLGLGSDGLKKRGKDDPRYVCSECAIIVQRVSQTRRLDQYELRAIDAGIDAVGEYLDTIGIYDLTLMDELNQRLIVKAAWQGCADGLRKALADEVPF